MTKNINRCIKRLNLIIIISFFSVSILQAQVTVELDSIMVTASRINTDISESGKYVTVFTRQDIENMPATSVDELLRSLPGVNINARQGFGVQSDVGIRGSTYSQVLFMLDNVPLNDPLTAHFNTNIPVSLSEIAQIELIRGPASTSFGADAVGGVVHIKTNMYLQRELDSSNKRGISIANFDIAGGQYNLLMTDATLAMQANRWRFSTSARVSRSDGETYLNPGFAEGVSSQPEYNTYFDLYNISMAISHRYSDRLSWYVRGGLDQRDFNARYFYTRSIFDESVEEIQSRWLLSAITYNRGSHRSEINASYRNVNDIFNFNSEIAPVNEHTTGQFFLNLSHQVELAGESSRFRYVRLMGGAQYLDKSIESTDRGDHHDRMGGIYAIGTASWMNGVSITSSLRLQVDATGQADLLPQISAAYNMQNLTFRSSAGRAVRVGDFTERYISSAIPNLTPLRNIGNPDLQPEKSTTLDLGLDWRPLNNFRFSPTLFYRISDNLIDYTLTNADNIPNATNLQAGEHYFYAQNISSSSTSGIELMGSGNFRIPAGTGITLQGGYTYIRTNSDQETVSRYIANHPSHQLSAGIQITHSWLSVYSQSEYNVRSPEAEVLVDGKVPSTYFITNLRITISPAESGVRLYSRIINVTDTKYQEILGAPMPGRWIMAGVQLSL
jgi:vitamin B12 transporter